MKTIYFHCDPLEDVVPRPPIPLILIVEEPVIEKSHNTFITAIPPFVAGQENANVPPVIVKDV